MPQENMTIIYLFEILNVTKCVAILLPREEVIRTASAIPFVLYRDISQTETMNYDLGIYVNSLALHDHLIPLTMADDIVWYLELADDNASDRRKMAMVFSSTKISDFKTLGVIPGSSNFSMGYLTHSRLWVASTPLPETVDERNYEWNII